MTISRNAPCPCGSGKKYKKCCLAAIKSEPAAQKLSPRFRFEHGSYGGPNRGFLPSAICYQQVAPGQWNDYFCLVNPTCHFANEDDASAMAEADLAEASAVKCREGSDAVFAMALKNKGYVKVEDFQRAKD